MAVKRIYCAYGINGGADGDLDTIDGQNLADNDMAIIIDADSDTVSFWRLEASGGHAGTENVDYVVPDDNPGTKEWWLMKGLFDDLTIRDDIITVVDDLNVGDDLTVTGDTELKGALQVGDADGTGSTVTIYTDTSGDHVVIDKTAKTATFTDVSIVMAGAATISAGDNNITNVGDIALDSISADGASFSMASDWTNAGRTVADLGSITTVDINGGTIDGVTIGGASAGAITGTTIDATTDFTIGGLVITDNTITDDGTLILAPATAVSFSDKPITNVGDIALDSISADGTEIDITLTDNIAAALEIKEGANTYLTFVTTDAGEKITLGKKLEAGAVEIEGSNFDINGGDISSATISAGLTWNAAQDLNNVNLTNVDIDSGDIATGVTINITDAGTYFGTDTVEAALQTCGAHLTSDGSDHTFIDQDVTNGSSPTFTGTNITAVATITLANEAADTTCFPIFAGAATGAQALETNAGLTFNASTATLTATNLAGANTNWDAAYTHVSNNGSDHSFIDQSVVSGASPTFDGANFTGVDADDVDIADAGALITATDVEGALAENRTAINLNTTHRSSNGTDHSYIDQDVTSGSSPTFDMANMSGSPDINGGTVDGATIGAASHTTIKGTTIDATTDFTIGGTVITDNTITDDGTLLLVPTTAVQVQGGSSLYLGTNDTTAGVMIIYGDNATNGGTIRIHTGATGDAGGLEYFDFAVDNDDLWIGPGGNTDAFKFIGTGGNDVTIQSTVAFDVDAALTATTVDADTDFTVGNTVITDGTITDAGAFAFDVASLNDSNGNIYCGVNNTTRGFYRAYGDSNITGGSMRLYTGANADTYIDYFDLIVTNDDLSIGPSGNLDALQFVGNGANADPGGSWSFTVPVDVDAALSATTVDADTDFTVGGTVITDNTITDDGTLVINATTAVSFSDKNITNVGDIALDSISADGASLSIDSNWDAAGVTCSDLGAVTTVDINGGSYDGGTLGAASAVTFTSLTAANLGQINWDDGKPDSNDQHRGPVFIEATVDQNTVGVNGCLVLSSDGNWDDADKDAEATVGQLALATDSGTGASKTLMLQGMATDTGWSWTVGSQVFVSDSGALTQTAPSGSGDFVQVVGYALAATTIYFNPSPDYIEIA